MKYLGDKYPLVRAFIFDRKKKFRDMRQDLKNYWIALFAPKCFLSPYRSVEVISDSNIFGFSNKNENTNQTFFFFVSLYCHFLSHTFFL